MKRLLMILVIFRSLACFAEDNSSLGPWRDGVLVKPAVQSADRHSIHTYFNTCPESPDGKTVLFFVSTTRNAQEGEIHLLDRASGKERTLIRNVTTEDAHRVACQQWVSSGRRVAFHDERNGEWIVAVVDIESGTERVLAKNRLSCWGHPNADFIPLYSPHWNPGEHRNLEMLNVETGEIKTIVTADAVKDNYPEWVAKNFGDKQPSVFFPVLSPDLKRVFFKMALAGNGDPRSKGASKRLGLICYSLEENRFLFMRDLWGHPAWHPDSKRIVEIANQLIDSGTGRVDTMPGLPNFGSGHPSVSPDGKLVVTDTTLERFGGSRNEWGIVVMDIRGTDHAIVHRFDNSKGARSWRVSHPHPVFSADGRRIYFNVSSGDWTQLHVAECGSAGSAANK